MRDRTTRREFAALFTGQIFNKKVQYRFLKSGNYNEPDNWLIQKNIIMKESAYKPGSVENSHSSRLQVTLQLKQSTQEPRGPRVCSSI